MKEEVPFFLQSLPAAYQLHYHIGLATRGKCPFFKPLNVRQVVEEVLADVCQQYGYHLLEHALLDNGLYLLVSLRPEHSVSGAVKSIRGNVWAALKNLGDPQPVWSRGIFVRSVSSVTVDHVANYVASQFAHHEVNPIAFEPVSYQGELSAMSDLRKSAHAVFEMNHHLVFAVQRREAFLDPKVARGLLGCWREAAAKFGIVVWRIEILPDHTHMVLGLQPSQVPAEVASRFLADSWRWLQERYAPALRFERLEDVWKQSYYVGTAGAATTAQVKSLLRKWGLG